MENINRAVEELFVEGPLVSPLYIIHRTRRYEKHFR